MVAAAADDADREAGGPRRYVGHYGVQTWAEEGGGWSMTLYHYGTPILNVEQAGDGSRTSAIDPAWWNSATDRSAIAKAHRALGMRRSIRRGALVAY
jgi:hypothetical protein